MNEADRKHVEETVERGDADRFVSAFFVPAERRGALLALHAFEVEVRHIGEAAREPMAGHVRLAWWREQIAMIYEGGSVHAPTARALSGVVRAHDLPRAAFDGCLDARSLDLEEAPFADAAAMAVHADAVAGSILKLACRVLGAGHRADDAAAHAGRAATYASHLRDLGFFAARRRCRLPLQWLAEGGIDQEDVFGAQNVSPALQSAFERMKAQARAELSALNASRYPRSATPALAHATLARWPSARGFDPLKPVRIPAWQRFARLALANLAWRF